MNNQDKIIPIQDKLLNLKNNTYFKSQSIRLITSIPSKLPKMNLSRVKMVYKLICHDISRNEE